MSYEETQQSQNQRQTRIEIQKPVNLQTSHTNFPFGVYFAQTLSLVFNGPSLEQLLEKCRLGAVIHRLHVCRAVIVLGFYEFL